MGCSGCGHRYNPASPAPQVNRVSLPGVRTIGRYHIRQVVRPVSTPATQVAVPANSGKK